MRTTLVIIFLIFWEWSFSQNMEIVDLRKRLEKIQDWYTWPNLDTQNQSTSDLLVKILKQREIFEYDSLPNFGMVRSADKKITLYHYSFDTGGTSLFEYHFFLQWRNPDGSFGAYDLLPYLDKAGLRYLAFYGSIENLPSMDGNIYLLKSQNIGPGFKYEYRVIQIVQVKGNELILNYPAFFNMSPILNVIYDPDSTSREDGNCEPIFHYDFTKFIIKIGLGDRDKIGDKTASWIKKLYGKNCLNFIWNGSGFSIRVE
jgi:hypothetical protein